MTIPANELKTKGIKAVEKEIEKNEEAVITVRGEQKFVIVDMKRYNYLRECELEAALYESKKDLENKNIQKESIKEHIKRVTSV
jgi:PHD/YefM family antitoxin component YafN of YafNO toxin-antitoxin module